MNTLKNLIGIILISIILNSCGQKEKPDNFDYGKVIDNVYTNTYFNLTMDIPIDWVILDQKQRKVLLEENSNSEDKTTKASEISEANLLNVFQYNLGAAVDFNPSIMVFTENNNSKSEIVITGAEYLKNAKKFLMQTQLQYEYISESIEMETINKIDFYKIEAHTLTAGDSIKQRYYATVINGFSLFFLITYTTEEQEAILLNAIHSITMKK